MGETNNDLLIRIDERVKEMSDNLKEIKITLHGNGKEGLCETATKNRDRITGLEKNFKIHCDNTKWIVGISIAAISIIVTVIVAILNYFKL